MYLFSFAAHVVTFPYAADVGTALPEPFTMRVHHGTALMYREDANSAAVYVESLCIICSLVKHTTHRSFVIKAIPDMHVKEKTESRNHAATRS